MPEVFGCQRCGYCCVYLSVVIPRVLSDGTMDYVYKPNDVLCPYLLLEEGQASCTIHDEEFFEETPCHLHNNPDHDPDLGCWRGVWRCIGPKLVEQGIFTKRPPEEYVWEEEYSHND